MVGHLVASRSDLDRVTNGRVDRCTRGMEAGEYHVAGRTAKEDAMGNRERCFELNEAAGRAYVRGDYGVAARLFHDAASCALTSGDATVLREKAIDAQVRAQRQDVGLRAIRRGW